MAEYARREGLDADAANRRKRVLRRAGQWIEADVAPATSKAVTVKKQRSAVRFARVAVSDTPPPSAVMLLRLLLINGRRAELEIGGIAQLGELISVLIICCLRWRAYKLLGRNRRMTAADYGGDRRPFAH